MRRLIRRASIGGAVMATLVAGVASPVSAAPTMTAGGNNCSPIAWTVRVAYKVCIYAGASADTVKLHIYNRQPQNSDSVLVYLAAQSSTTTRVSPTVRYSWGSRFTVPANQSLTITRTYDGPYYTRDVEAMVNDTFTPYGDRPFVLASCYLEACGIGGAPDHGVNYQIPAFFQ